MASKAPPPITPSRGHRAPDERPPKRPDWNYWLQFPKLELWQLVALTCDMDPRRIGGADKEPWQDDYPARERATYKERREIAEAHGEDLQLNAVAPAYTRVPIPAFLVFASRKNWPLFPGAEVINLNDPLPRIEHYQDFTVNALWTWYQAAHVIQGFRPASPDGLDPEMPQWAGVAEMRLSDRWKVSKLYELIKTECEVGRLPFAVASKKQWQKVEPARVVAYARTLSRQLNWLAIAPEIDQAFPQQPDTPAIPAIPAILDATQGQQSQKSQPDDEAKRARFIPEIPTPQLEYENAEALARTFANVKDQQGKPLNWARLARYASRPNGLGCVDSRPGDSQGKQGKPPNVYNPEGVALWLIRGEGLSQRTVGEAIYNKVRKLSDEWDDKAEYWRKVKAGEIDLRS